MSEYPSMYDAAIEYAKKGFAVFPLKYRDKVPLTRNGCKDATTDAAQIKAWWQQHPNANIGLATGSVSQNVFVIDLDIDEDRGIDGYHSLEDWQREHGDFPETWTAITGRGGYHLYYRGNGKIKNRAGIIDGVDIRGNGGYVVAPPSIHKNGNRYEWEYSPDEFELAKADNNVMYFLNHDDHRQSASFTMPNIVSAGQRNQMLFRFACMMQAKGASGTFLKLMALDDSWFNDSLDSLDSDKAVQSLTGSWIIELAELKSLARTAGGVESVKRFLTATQDKYRIPYERRADTFYRQCVFAGTTNKDDFLQDETGNRRFLIIHTGVTKPFKSLFVPEAMDDIKQAWAEAVHIWKNEDPELILPEKCMQQAKELQEANMADDGKRGIIQEYLEGKTQVCAREIWEKALGENVSPRKYQITEINDIIAKVPGWKKLKSPRNFEGYGKQRGFQKTVLQTENEKATNFSEFVPISRQEQMEIPFD